MATTWTACVTQHQLNSPPQRSANTSVYAGLSRAAAAIRCGRDIDAPLEQLAEQLTEAVLISLDRLDPESHEPLPSGGTLTGGRTVRELHFRGRSLCFRSSQPGLGQRISAGISHSISGASLGSRIVRPHPISTPTGFFSGFSGWPDSALAFISSPACDSRPQQQNNLVWLPEQTKAKAAAAPSRPVLNASGESKRESRKRRGDDSEENLGPMPEARDIDASDVLGPVTRVTRASSDDSQGQSEEIDEALKVMPNRYYTDLLVQNFLSRANYYYYILYPPQFSKQYSDWWSDRAANKPLTPELTSLILLTCACSCQFLKSDLRDRVEPELGVNASVLNQRFAKAAKRLSATISPGRGGMTLVVQKLLTAFWCKSEALFIEAWHVLSAAIREAQELGIHKNSHPRGLSEFDIDMRKRLWSLLYMWDWEMSLVLCRPLIINFANCTFELPRLDADELEPPADGSLAVARPSTPFTHILLQCQLIKLIDKNFGVLNLPLPADLAATLSNTIQEWITTFPPSLRTENPDTRWDASHPWLPVARPYFHAITFTMIVVPLKPHIIKSVPRNGSSLERNIRAKGVDAALKLVAAAQQLFTDIYPNDAKFHFSFFSLFDTAALLCSAIKHDHNGTLPRRDELVEPIKMALDALNKLSTVTETADTAYKVLRTLANDLPLSQKERAIFGRHLPAKRLRATAGPQDEGDPVHQQPEVLRDLATTVDAVETSIFPPMVLPEVEHVPMHPGTAMFAPGVPDLPTTQDFSANQMFGLNVVPEVTDLSSFELGNLGYVWDWHSLDLGQEFPPPPQ
ncbi:uncharacterized protein E0L32_011448 [Thyridium curvatum]|uniref:Xylanolytic transcriptional activator regulatory domain-containing protein n=1 Tax=Thyridium curvatum TaxID=1093900 RepID=A0A507BHN3_9PEZI|nr:uncharacterized protein E0L32_011448 [Thyridium curvatum]TPX18896.1 hypothetical protein E0L32_011448 [Thyridium curvatum]